MKKTLRRRKLLRDDRGSALLVSLMVIVGLSLLGLGFVALSETESAIAKNQAAALQTQAVAESGAKLVVEWFQDPKWARNYGGCPSNDPAINGNIGNAKVVRVITGSPAYTGVYKPKSTELLFDKPYRSTDGDRFFGTEDKPDVKINSVTDQPTLDKINQLLLGVNAVDKASGEITEIDVYSPPMVGAFINGNGFWQSGQRYGVATIKAVAQQFRDPSAAPASKKYAAANVMSSHTVRLVVGELPLPIPAGPIQGNANVSFGGNFRVHWGMETSQATLTPSLSLSALPWANAYERPHFEHGYEPGSSIARVIVTSGGSGYAGVPNVVIAPPGGGGTPATATAVVNGAGVVTAIDINIRGSGYISAPPPGDWTPTVTIDPPGGAGTRATAIASIGTEHWPISSAQYDREDYFNELLGKSFDDPWYGSRSVGDNLIDGATAQNSSMQCWGYDYTSDETSNAQPSYAFQWQDTNQYPLKKIVTFPVIKYNYWKRIAQQGRGYKGIYYFNYAGSAQFEKFNGGVAQPMYYWVNTIDGAKLGAGVYFFDTRDGSNPQLANGGTNTAVLTDPESWQANNFGKGMLMQGFIYMNTQQFGTTGQGQSATTLQVNFPGEPYRDIGTPHWNVGNNDWVRTPSGQIQIFGIGDGQFSHDELNNNNHFDVVVMPAPNWKSYDPNATNGPGGNYVVKTWKPHLQAMADYGADCTVPPANYNGSNGLASDCSEPHEPYLNLLYPTTAANNAGAPTQVTVGWEDGANQNQRRAKVLDSSFNPVTCTQGSSTDDCTSNAHDDDGGLVPLSVILDGVVYNEGNYDASGNSWYFGSLLIRGTIGPGGGGANGTADVWFDEKLLKGTWSPPDMPRVIVFNEQTDETQP